MPKIMVLPHRELCPEGIAFETYAGISICDALLAHDVDIGHACDHDCACTSCHIIVRMGFDSLRATYEEEEAMLGKAKNLTPKSRLSCQAIVCNTDLVVEIPR